MTFTTHQSTVRTLKPGDCNFRIIDGMVITSRAAIEISKNCPRRYVEIIEDCVKNGWLKPIANVTERELLFMGLSKE